jgi:hypothetical protein
MMRSAAAWGDTNTIDKWVVGRQGGRWAEQTVRAAMPRSRTRDTRAVSAHPADPAQTLRDLQELHERGVVTDAEFEALRAGLRR